MADVLYDTKAEQAAAALWSPQGRPSKPILKKILPGS